jgi:hypothetical protein
MPSSSVRVQRPRLEALGQRGPLDEVGDDERAAVLDPAVVQGDEPGVVQGGERAHLALLAAPVVRRGAGVEELDGERAAGDPVQASADHRRRPRSEQRTELVAPADHRRVGPGGRDGPLVHGRGVPGDPVDHTKPHRSCTNPETDGTLTGTGEGAVPFGGADGSGLDGHLDRGARGDGVDRVVDTLGRLPDR